MRVRLPIVLLAWLIVLCAGDTASSQGAGEIKSFTTNLREFFIPFSADKSRNIKETRLYVQRNGSDWEYLTSAQATDKGFRFRTTQDGSYAFATQTEYTDGTTDRSKDQLSAQYRVIIDSVPPKINVSPFATGDSAGVEWDIVDDTLDANSIRLEYRWPGMADWRPIDPGVTFRARDQRTWLLRADQRIEIRVRAKDRAGNEGFSTGVWTSLAAGERRSGTGAGGSGIGDGPGMRHEQGGTTRTGGIIQHVNQKEITLDFNVNIGSSGLKKVRLYRTENGQDWRQAQEFTPDPDHPSAQPGERSRSERLSITHVVEKEGEYGFIIIAESRAGKAPPAPKLKDPAHLKVVVDLSKPKVRIVDTKVRQAGEQSVAVDIAWSAEDVNLAPSPITLKYSEKREGPWKSIIANLDNTGRHTWTVPASEPNSFFLKIEAVDRAGNVGEAISNEAIELDLVVPQVDIQGVTPGKPKKQPKDLDGL